MDQQNLENIRHSAAHMLAAAVLELYPGTKLGIGPTVENGFYYDFLFPNGMVISENDLAKIEETMKKIIKGNHNFSGRKVTADQAKEEEKEQQFKLELINEFAQEGKELTMYESGPFKDLCRGGHVDNTKEIPVDGLKLQRIAGAYWRGSEKNPMLTRIYGLLFSSKEELETHLKMLEEAEKRDHRKIGAEQELFTFSPKIGPGLVLWLPKGNIIKEELEKWAKEMEEKSGYVRVTTPVITKEDLFYTSEHLPHYKSSMYSPMDIDGENYYIKPMNCPFHHTIFAHRKRSYRELPLRLAEYGWCHRYEDSGSLFGLMRVRGMQMNDAHIYCTKEQAMEEFVNVIKLHQYYYDKLGIKDYYMELALRNPDNDKYHGDDEMWKEAEELMREAMKISGVPYVVENDGAAFYGPKIDFKIKSVTGRLFTSSTNQIDLFMPKKFDLTYIDADGKEKYVACVHRAPLGTHERFIGFLIEHFAGAWPVWLSPVQVLLAPVSSKHVDGARQLAQELAAVGIRVENDEADETIGNKVRKAAGQKIPYIVVVGDKELGGEPWMIRVRGQKDQIKMTKEEFIQKVIAETKDRVV